MTLPESTLVGSYDYRLVTVSVLIAVLAAYTALDLAARVTAARAAVSDSLGSPVAPLQWALASGPCTTSACWHLVSRSGFFTIGPLCCFRFSLRFLLPESLYLSSAASAW